MSPISRLSADPWMWGWALAGALLLAVAAIGGLPWLLWIGWAYVGVLCAADVLRGDPSDRMPTT